MRTLAEAECHVEVVHRTTLTSVKQPSAVTVWQAVTAAVAAFAPVAQTILVFLLTGPRVGSAPKTELTFNATVQPS